MNNDKLDNNNLKFLLIDVCEVMKIDSFLNESKY